jgi:hypothetical protein
LLADNLGELGARLRSASPRQGYRAGRSSRGSLTCGPRSVARLSACTRNNYIWPDFPRRLRKSNFAAHGRSVATLARAKCASWLSFGGPVQEVD